MQPFVVAQFRASLPYPQDEAEQLLPYLHSLDTHVLQTTPLALDARDQGWLGSCNAIHSPVSACEI